MKILLSDNTLSGLLNFRGEVVKMFLDEGHRVTLVAPSDPLSAGMPIPEGAVYIPVTLSRTGANPFEEIGYYRTLKKIYRAEAPDHIFHYTIKPNIYGTVAAHRLGIPSSAMIPGLGRVYVRSGVVNSLARAMYRYSLRWAEDVLVLNVSDRDSYKALIETRRAKKPRLWLLEGGEGVDLERFTPRPMPHNPRPVFLMIARLLYEKGYAEYVAAARSLAGQAEFRLMGSLDPHPSSVSAETLQRDKEAITYIPHGPDVEARIAAADCVVLPSCCEGLSRVLMEGAATGRPLIASDIAGCRPAIEQGVNGWLVTPHNAEALTDACRRFISLSPAQRAKMGAASRKLAEERFDMGRVFDIYRKIPGDKYSDK